eukprot:1301624-Pleurochrysis_carterae.AAC.4
MLTSYSRTELVAEENGVQRVLVEVQNVFKVVLELEELSPALVWEVGHPHCVAGHDDAPLGVCGRLSAGKLQDGEVVLILPRATWSFDFRFRRSAARVPR